MRPLSFLFGFLFGFLKFLLFTEAFVPLKPIMHIEYSPYFHKIYEYPPYFLKMYKFSLCFHPIYMFLLNLSFFASPILAMMPLCLLLYTYWMPLAVSCGLMTSVSQPG